jgi:hypothetical protein
VLRLRLGYSWLNSSVGIFRQFRIFSLYTMTLETGNQKLETCFPQFPASEKFTVIWVSTSTGSLFRM